jgi:hypothetical protein
MNTRVELRHDGRKIEAVEGPLEMTDEAIARWHRRYGDKINEERSNYGGQNGTTEQ